MQIARFLLAFWLTFTHSSLLHARLMEAGDVSETQTVEQPASPILNKLANWIGKDNAKAAAQKWNQLKKKWTAFWDERRQTPEQRQLARQREEQEKAVQKKIESLPSYVRPDKAEYKQQAEQARQNLKDQGILKVVTPGTKGGPLPKVIGKNIPVLNVGTEPEISKSDFSMPNIKVSVEDFLAAQSLPTVKPADGKEVKLVASKPIVEVGGPKADRKDWGVDKPVTSELIAKQIPQLTLTNDNIELRPVNPLTQDQLTALAATIVFEKSDQCHVVIGLAEELLTANGFANDGRFFIGSCSHKLQLFSDAVEYLLPLIKSEHPQYASKSIEILTKNLPREYHALVAPVLVELKNQQLIPEKSRDDANFMIARWAVEVGKETLAIQRAEKVANSSPHFTESLFVLGVAKYTKEGSEAARPLFEKVKNMTEISGSKNLRNLATLNLARIYFQKGDYKQALETYRALDKDHPTWVQAMTELGWAQIAMEDYAGAIGNMYSMHSPYFETVYKPESYVVRALGYLEICQFGDAYRMITRLESLHREWMAKVENYRKSHGTDSEYYTTVASYLRSRSQNDVDGLPHQIIREMARRRNFLNLQDFINEKVDEKPRYQRQIAQISKEISKAQWRMNLSRERIGKLSADLKKAQTNKALSPFVSEWQAQMRTEERLILGYAFQTDLFRKAQKQFQKLEGRSMARIKREESRLKAQAAKALRTNLASMAKQMGDLLENNELLRYEVFAGSGENIRYHASGGATEDAKRIPAHVKPKKIMNWEFDGEYWEDEIGSYRSSLQNNCPKYRQAKVN